MQVIVFLKDHALEIVTALLLISEALDFIPGIKASSISKAIKNGLVKLKDILTKPKDPA